MLKARWIERTLQPRFELGTSKGTIGARTVWYLIAWDDARPELKGIGEAALFPGHSLEFPADVRVKLIELCERTDDWEIRMERDLVDVPCVRFAVEQCLLDLAQSGSKQLFPSEFVLGKRGIPINGLVWMGDKRTMRERIKQQLNTGHTTLKMKIGAIGWDDESDLLREVRSEYGPSDLTIRVDANGAFAQDRVRGVLDQLASLHVHSIEQPIAAGLIEAMAELCADTPVPIALDEELIGHHRPDIKNDLLDHIRPQFIVIKPSLVGGFKATREWIRSATERGIGWWITSALESNIGLNAIAQFTAVMGSELAQGLGTGKVYANNIPSPLVMEKGFLHYRPEGAWDLAELLHSDG